MVVAQRWLVVAAAAAAGATVSSDGILPKRTTSPSLRFVFFAGIEGTGHHAARALFSACAEADAQLCVARPELSETLRADAFAVLWGTNATLARARLVAAFGAVVREDAKASEEHDGAVAEKLIFLNSAPEEQFLSYPGGGTGGKDRALRHPNVLALATAAETAGVDLRVVVLDRDARDVLISTTVHRHFDAPPRQALVLGDNAAVLAAQLGAIDAAFAACLPYARMADAAWWRGHAAWLHPRLAADERWRPLLASVRGASSSSSTGSDSNASDAARRPTPRDGLAASRELRNTKSYTPAAIAPIFVQHLDAMLGVLRRTARCRGEG